MAAGWNARICGGGFGPVPTFESVQDAADGRIAPKTGLRKGPAGPWARASKVASLFERAAQVGGADSLAPSTTPTFTNPLQDQRPESLVEESTRALLATPTQDTDQRLQSGGIATLATAPRTSNTNTNTTT
jgi:hypothetical protein